MRILLASTSSGSQGGGEIFLHYLGQALHDMGHTVGLWVSEHSRMDGLCQQMEPYADVLRVPYQNTYDLPGRSVQAYWHRGHRELALKSWEAWRPDIIHLNKQNLEDGLDLVRALTETSIPSLSTIHITQSACYLGASKARLRDAISRWTLRGSTSPIITVSDQRGADLKEFLMSGPAPVETIYNGIPEAVTQQTREETRVGIGIQEDEILVTMLGRLTAQKSPEVFLDHATNLSTQHPKARFLWIGSGDSSTEFDQQVEARGLQSIVQRLEWQDDVSSWLQASDVYFHTAAYEGLPLALLEAMAAGLPCVTSKHVLAEAAPLSQGAVLSYDNDWSLLLRSAAFRREKADACRKLFEDQFHVKQMANRYAATYSTLLSAKLAA